MLQITTILLTIIMTIIPAFAWADAPVKLPKTGQTTSHATGDDGATQRGVAWPSPRFTDNNNGTVTDNLTGLIWLQNANCTDTVAGINKSSGYLVWADALAWSNGLADGACGLTDGSQAGDWQLPNRKELTSLIDRSQHSPALPVEHPFTAVQSNFYWSSSAYASNAYDAWYVDVDYGGVNYSNEYSGYYVWPVRVGQ